MDEDNEFELADDKDYIDIDGTIEALREAWNCMPDASLSELLDTVTTMPFVEMTNRDLIEELNNFVLQNHSQ